jgi:hypothetical protein
MKIFFILTIISIYFQLSTTLTFDVLVLRKYLDHSKPISNKFLLILKFNFFINIYINNFNSS